VGKIKEKIGGSTMKIKLFEKIDDTPISKATPEQIEELKRAVKGVEDTTVPALKRTMVKDATPEQIQYVKDVVAGKKKFKKPLEESYTNEELLEVFKHLNLDTEKYTFEYLAEQLGFEAVYPKDEHSQEVEVKPVLVERSVSPLEKKTLKKFSPINPKPDIEALKSGEEVIDYIANRKGRWANRQYKAARNAEQTGEARDAVTDDFISNDPEFVKNFAKRQKDYSNASIKTADELKQVSGIRFMESKESK
jgi:hypothetical protein